MRLRILQISFLLFSILIFFYVLYKSEIHFSSQNRDYYLKYFILTFFFILISIVSFFLNKKINYIFFSSFITLIFTFFLFEAYLTFFVESNYIKVRAKIYQKETGKKYNTLSRKEFLKKEKIIDKNIVVTVHPTNHMNLKENKILPLSGISNVRTIYCNEGGFYSIYNSDRYGFNNPDEEWDKKIDFILLGDSFVHGACVNRPNDITSSLRNLGFSALNLGYGGNGPMTMYATLKEFYQKDTKFILWFYYYNDHNNLKNEKNDPILNKYIDDETFTQNLINNQELVNKKNFELIFNQLGTDNNFINIVSFLKLSELRFLVIQYFTGQNEIAPSQKIGIDNYYFEVLKKVKIFSETNNSKIFFVYVPDYSEIKNEKINNEHFTMMKKKVEDLNISFIDLKELTFLKQNNPLEMYLFKLPGHLNNEANKKIANSIFKFIYN